MNKIRDEELVAYVDGEAEPELVARIEAARHDDHALHDRIDAMQRSRRLLRQGFGQLDDWRPPAELIERVQASAPRAQTRRRRARSAFVPFAMAASVAIAAFLGALLILNTDGSERGLVALALAQPFVQQGLEQQLSGEPLTGTVHGAPAEFMATASWRTAEGAACREFEIYSLDEATSGGRGLACRRQGGGWELAVVYGAEPAETSSDRYLPASGGTDSIAQQLSDGRRLLPHEEREQVESDWKNFSALRE